MFSLRRIACAVLCAALLLIPALSLAGTAALPEAVREIGQDAFSGDPEITEAVIPDDTEIIGAGAFSGCTGLMKVLIPAGVEEIGSGAFTGCPLLVIYGYTGTVAETYAAGNGIPFAALDAEPEGLSFALNSAGDAYTVTGFTGTESCIILPSVHEGKPVTAIESSAFRQNTALIRVDIPDSVTKIGSYAFRECTSLTAVTLSGATTLIGDSAFEGCTELVAVQASDAPAGTPVGYCGLQPYAFRDCTKLESVTVPGGVEEIFHTTFNGCAALQTVVIREGVTRITFATNSNAYRGAFEDCAALTNVSLPSTLTEIGARAFSGCTALAAIDLPASLTRIDENAFYGCSALQGIALPASLTQLGGYAFYGCANLHGPVVLPDRIAGIDTQTFAGCSALDGVTVPDSVTAIGYAAFRDCTSLTAITLSGATTYIGESAFDGCSALVTVAASDAPAGVSSESSALHSYAFNGCTSLTSVTVPGGVSRIEHTSFNTCSSLQTVVLREGITRLVFATNSNAYRGVFEGCAALTSVSLPSTLTEIGARAFSGCTALAAIDLPASLTRIDENAFSGCSALQGIALPASLTQLGGYAFYGCANLHGPVVLPDGIAGIDTQTFAGCSALDGVTVPDSVTAIGYAAFRDCTSLTAITLSGATTYIGESAFDGCSALVTVAASDAPAGVSSESSALHSYAFNGCTSLTSVTVPGGVSRIEHTSFNTCSSLQTVVLREGITRLVFATNSNAYRGVFEGCASLTSVSLPSTLTEIGARAFSGCTALPVIGLPASLTRIDESAFSGCSSLQGPVTIPAGVTVLSYAVFRDCSSLRQITVSAETVQIHGSAFLNCCALETVELPDSVTSIGDSAFSGCVSLSSIHLTDALTSIGSYAFSHCPSLTGIYLGAGLTSLGEGAFNECTGLAGRVTIADGITYIAGKTFYHCRSLEGVTIGADVTEIAYDAFTGCDRLVIYGYSNTAAMRYAFDHGFCFVFLGTPDEYVVGTYGSNHVRWTYFVQDKILVVDTVGYVEEAMIDQTAETFTAVPWYDYVQDIRQVQIRTAITGIGDYTFYQYPALASVVIDSDSIAAIGAHAFDGCTSLRSVRLLRGGLQTIGDYAFHGCSLMGSFVDSSPEALETVGDYAFNNCSALTGITLLRNVSSIGEGAFDGVRKAIDVRCEWGSYAWTYMEGEDFLYIKEPSYNLAYETYDVTFDHSIEYYLARSKSGVPEPGMQFICSLMSGSAYYSEVNSSKSGYGAIEKNYRRMGFENIVTDWSYSIGDHVGFTMGRKDTADGKRIVLVSVRGTEGPWPDSTDWQSNLWNVGPDSSKRHAGINAAAQEVYAAVLNYENLHAGNVVVVLTGHSRGGGVANIVAADLISKAGIPSSRVIAYTFASPKIATAGTFETVNCPYVFNIRNTNDLVPKVPFSGWSLESQGINAILALFDEAVRHESDWGRYGNDNPFTAGQDLSYFLNIWHDNFDAAGKYLGINHTMHLYINHAFSEYN